MEQERLKVINGKDETSAWLIDPVVCGRRGKERQIFRWVVTTFSVKGVVALILFIR